MAKSGSVTTLSHLASSVAAVLLVAVVAGACAGGADAVGVACQNLGLEGVKFSFTLPTSRPSLITCIVLARQTAVADVELLAEPSLLTIGFDAKLYVVPAEYYPALIGSVKLVVFPSGGPCGHGMITVAAFAKRNGLDMVDAKVKVCLPLVVDHVAAEKVAAEKPADCDRDCWPDCFC